MLLCTGMHRMQINPSFTFHEFEMKPLRPPLSLLADRTLDLLPGEGCAYSGSGGVGRSALCCRRLASRVSRVHTGDDEVPLL